MKADLNESNYSLSQADQDELDKLVGFLELISSTTTIFAIAPESGPQHPVVEQLKSLVSASDEEFQFQNFYYSDNSLHNFLYSEVDRLTDRIRSPQPPLESIRSPQPPLERGTIEDRERRMVVMAFGIDQLPTPRLVREMKQLNLGRDSLFERELVLIFWLNKVEFLEEFRNRAPDFWDWRGKVVRFETRPVFNPLFYPYLEWLIAENSYLKISGVMQVQRQVDIFLDQIYVSLQAERRQLVTETLDRSQRELEAMTSRHAGGKSRRRSSTPYDLESLDDFEPLMSDFVPVATSTKVVTQKVDLSQAVRESQYGVILGAPGAGKTTLLRYLALHFATAKRDDKQTVLGGEAQEELGKPLLPIFFRIADYAERLNEQPNLTLLDYLRQFYRQWEVNFKNEAEAETGTEVAALLLDAMRQGQCLMLLDGLDEVFDQESRRLIVGQIDRFVEAFSTNKFVITSRIAGYRDVKLSDRFTEFTIEDMGSEQAQKFLNRWCQAIEQAQQPDASEEQWQRVGDTQAREILEAIQTNEGVKRLTANPLLLTILALIHRNGSRLPNRRVELYALAVKTLTEDWQLGKKLPDASKVVLKENEVVELLAPLAYWMHEEKPSGLVTQEEVEERLAAKLAELNDADPESDSVQQAVEQFLRKVRETTGLFVERAPGVYGFMHLTFEEYFAARHIADNDQSEILRLIRSHLHEPRWNEPILLALGYYGIHSPRQVNKLVGQLFSNLEAYEPATQHGEIKIKNGSSPDAVLIWSALQSELATTFSPSELPLKDLLFAGQVLAQVEVNSSTRKKLIQKLVLTLVLGTNFEMETNKQLLRVLRQIELFNQKGEVIDRLKQAVNDSTLSEEMRIKAQSAILYVACGQSGAELVNCVAEIVNQIEPAIFSSIQDLVAELGEEMTLALERNRQSQNSDRETHTALTFLTAMSYVRTDNYEKAIALFEEIINHLESSLCPYMAWALATCYQEKNEFEKAINYYQEAFEKLAAYTEPVAFLPFWKNRGICHRLHAKYEQSIECFQRMLAISQEVNKSEDEADAYFELGRVYQDWGKYKQAIAHYQQSRDFYEQLGKQKNVGWQWDWLAACYRDWGKYAQALECQQQRLRIHQALDDKLEVANAYRNLGRIYQAWGKYEQAIAHHQQSRDLYEQLGRDKDVANQWYWLADCYRDWGKYEQAIECQQQCLMIRQRLELQPSVALAYYQLGRIYQAWGKYEQASAHYQQSRDLKDLAICQQLEDQPNIALAYFQLGCIYQAWGKYEEAIAHFQQSRDLYEQLGREENVANQWYWLAACYREWGKYEQALECSLKDLAIRQQLEDQPNIADAYYQLGRIYQAWGKYEQAIAHHQQSRDLYEQLGQEQDVANQWLWLADCYRDWGKYEQAMECGCKGLEIRQQLDDQKNIANAYLRLGRIYQAWGKYEQAIAHYQQSRDLYEQLGKQKDVAKLWFWIANCYRDWGKYQQAVECSLEGLAISQQLEDQPNIASSYNQQGYIYQAWGKYEQAIAHYQQSRDLYEQLGRDKDVANLWTWLAICYREWGKYEQAMECGGKGLEIRQQLDDQKNIANAYLRLGRIYQAWGRYEEAIAHYQQSCDLCEQLGLEKNVADLWNWLADCYYDWGKYEQAVECELKNLASRQQLDDQPNIAHAYYQLGRICQAWGKYEEAIAYYQQSRDLYEQLGLEKNVANQWSWLAACYRDLDDYIKAIKYYQQSRDLHQKLGQDERVAKRLRAIGNSQCLLAKKNQNKSVALNLLAQAEPNIRQALQLDTEGDYKENLAYDYTTLGLLWSERLCLLPTDAPSLPEQIAQFEEYYNTGLAHLAELGKTVERAEEALDRARAYLEVNVLENLDRAEELAQESLQVFQDYNRRKLEAAAHKLLGEIYLSRAQRNQPGAEATAHQFLTESLQIYRELDLNEKATEVEQLMHPNAVNSEQNR